MTSQYITFLCNGAVPPKKRGKKQNEANEAKCLNYDQQDSNLTLSLPKLRLALTHISPRLVDLLEIASYTFCGDRLTSRGTAYQEHHDSWTRKLKFMIKVRDVDFWTGPVQNIITELLAFATGDAEITYEFQAKNGDMQCSLFDSGEFAFPSDTKTKIALFSGGLDSLSGAVDILESTQDSLCLVSHDSGNTGTHRTQKKLIGALQEKFGENRIAHYPFVCKLKISENKAVEETQRSRIFLYSSIAFTLATTYQLDYFYIFENGVTSLNFPKRQDMNRGRASRTTHPKTIHLLERLFSTISEAKFQIVTPFYNKTKADIVKILLNSSQGDLISSSVSCAHTRMNSRTATHCGCCNQCVDRRIATFASGLHEKGIYDIDFLENPLNKEGTTIVIDYFNFISQVHQMSLTDFCCSFANELADALFHLPQSEHHSRTAEIYQLFEDHSQT